MCPMGGSFREKTCSCRPRKASGLTAGASSAATTAATGPRRARTLRPPLSGTGSKRFRCNCLAQRLLCSITPASTRRASSSSAGRFGNGGGLYLFFLPPYSPHLNIAETVWRHLKGGWLRPTDYARPDDLAYATNRCLANFGKALTITFSPSKIN